MYNVGFASAVAYYQFYPASLLYFEVCKNVDWSYLIVRFVRYTWLVVIGLLGMVGTWETCHWVKKKEVIIEGTTILAW